MGRVLLVGAIGSTFVFVVAACSSFGADSPSDPDASGADGATTPDGGVPTEEASGKDAGDASTVGTCTSFASGPSGFDLYGDAVHNAGLGGIVLGLNQDQEITGISRTYEIGKAFSFSAVTVDVDVSIVGAWGGSSAYISFLSQYLGSVADSDESPAASLALVDNDLEANVWHAPAKYTGNHAFGVVVTGGAHTVRLETVWGDNGRVTVFYDGMGASAWSARTRSTPATGKLTVEVGGLVNGTTPAYDIIVKKVCVEAE